MITQAWSPIPREAGEIGSGSLGLSSLGLTTSAHAPSSSRQEVAIRANSKTIGTALDTSSLAGAYTASPVSNWA